MSLLASEVKFLKGVVDREDCWRACRGQGSSGSGTVSLVVSVTCAAEGGFRDDETMLGNTVVPIEDHLLQFLNW